MFSFLGKIFGSDKIMDAGIKGIDALVFTPEEKAKLHLDFLKQYEPFKLAQRYLAIMFSGVYLFVYLVAISIWLIGAFSSSIEMQGFYMATAFELAKWNTETLGTAVALIIGFYFAGGVISGFKSK